MEFFFQCTIIIGLLICSQVPNIILMLMGKDCLVIGLLGVAATIVIIWLFRDEIFASDVKKAKEIIQDIADGQEVGVYSYKSTMMNNQPQIVSQTKTSGRPLLLSNIEEIDAEIENLKGRIENYRNQIQLETDAEKQSQLENDIKATEANIDALKERKRICVRQRENRYSF